MSKRKFENIMQIVQESAGLDVDSDKGYEAFRAIARREGIDPNRLMYYTNAYEAAGESGVKALSYLKCMPDEIRNGATKKIDEFLKARIPDHAKDKVGFQVVAKDNRITLAEKRPYFKDETRATTSDFAQFRYTDYDNRWHLYWKRGSGKWWPYVPGKKIETVGDCIREIKADAFGCFWG